MGFEHRVSLQDDDLHEVREDIPLWSESALIVCHDPATGLSVYGHLVLLETQVWESIFSVYLPNGEILTDRSYSRHDPVDRRTGQMVIEPIAEARAVHRGQVIVHFHANALAATSGRGRLQARQSARCIATESS